MALLILRLCQRPRPACARSVGKGRQRARLLAFPVAPQARLVHPVVPALHLAGVLVEHRRPASRLRQALRCRRSRCAGPRRVRAARRRRPPPRSAARALGSRSRGRGRCPSRAPTRTWCTVPTCSPSDASTGTPFSSTSYAIGRPSSIAQTISAPAPRARARSPPPLHARAAVRVQRERPAAGISRTCAWCSSVPRSRARPGRAPALTRRAPPSARGRARRP